MLYSSFTADLIGITGLYYGVAYLVISSGLTWICIRSEPAAEIICGSDLA
jgi:hypothetical protein